PLYTNYRGFAALLGIELRAVCTYADTGYHLPPVAEISKCVGPRTKAILYSSPGNPTGTVLSRQEIEAIVQIAKERDLFVLADEVYREFTFEEARSVSLLEVAEECSCLERAVILDSASKRHSLCGGRIGALVTHNEAISAAAVRMAQARLSSPTLEQVGAAALMDLPAAYYESIRQEYARRRDIVHRALCAIPGTICAKPEGAFYVLPRLPLASAGRPQRELFDAEALARFLLLDFELQGETVMVAPGAGFYITPGLGSDEVRIAYVLGSPRLERAMEVFRRGVEAFMSGASQLS
ncbi:MAG: aminotransferase class I/II-fold pyridoxal phosphate-dependent enzyme, partial [Pseudomonadota bacterium]